jgi:AcrR family transcriptional regulator
VTRPYHSAVRARAALETRTAVLKAASELFVEVGYAQASVAAIAERAGFAVNTVYTSVGGKPALIQALVGETAGDTAIDESVAGILALTDGREVLHRTARRRGRADLPGTDPRHRRPPGIARPDPRRRRSHRRDPVVLLRRRGLGHGSRVRLGMGGGRQVVR